MTWSDWQVYGDKTFDVIVHDTTGGSAVHGAARQDSGAPPIPGDIDLAAQYETERSDMVAGLYETEFAPAPYSTGYIMQDALKANEAVVESSAPLLLQQTSAYLNGTTFATDLDFNPPLLATLTYGVDYAENPDTGDFVEYESDTSTFVGWLDATLWMLLHGSNQMSRTVDTALVSTEGFDVPELDILVYLSESNLTDDWLAAAPGTLLDTLTMHPVNGGGDTGAATVESAALALSSVATPDLTLSFQTAYLAATPLPVSDFPLPPTGFTDLLRLWAYAQFVETSAATVTGWTFQIVYTLPRFRYWIPDEKLRTVGDHFRSVGGADIKSLIPGVGWVKVRRGT